MWLSTMKRLPFASQEASAAMEAYHVKLKAKLFDDSHLGALQRVDWLVRKLTTELHLAHWLDLYAGESDSFQNVKEEYTASTSWPEALQVPDSAVTLDDKGHLFAKVASREDSSRTHLFWNPGSDFAFCDCFAWSMKGNLCKHVIKVNMIRESEERYKPFMSFRSFREILMYLWKIPTDDSIALDESVAGTQQMLDQSSNDIGIVVNNMPLKWVSKDGKTFVRYTSFPSSSSI